MNILPCSTGAERARDKNDPVDLYAKLWVHTRARARSHVCMYNNNNNNHESRNEKYMEKKEHRSREQWTIARN